MNRTSESTSPRSISRLGRLLAPLGLAVAIATMSAGPTFAADNNAPNLTINGYGASVGASVACNAANSTLTVSASATTLQTIGWLGVTTGPYDGGQWIRYNVWAKDLDATLWTPVYTWSRWQWIRSVTSTTYVEYLNIPQDLGTSVVNGTRGHNYQVLVQIDWWTGAENIANVFPTYSQVYNSYTLAPGYCHL